MDNRIKTALLGYGLSGKVFHAPFLHCNDGFDLVKVLERHHEHSKEKYPYVEVVKNTDDILNDDTVELVIIALPNTLHFPVAERCLKAGKHIIIDKPFTPASFLADQLIEIAGQMDRKIFVFHNRRWDGNFQTVLNIVKSGLLGEILEYEAHFDRFNPGLKKDAWRDRPEPGAGILFDLGPHLIDQALVLFGKPESLFADIRNQRKYSEVDDYFELHLFYENHKAILKAGMFVKEPSPSYLIHGRKGSFIKYGLDPQEQMLKKGNLPVGDNWGKEETDNWGILNIISKENKREKIETIPGNYHGFFDNVYHVIRNGKQPEVTPEQARDVIKIVELAFQSHETKRVITNIDL